MNEAILFLKTNPNQFGQLALEASSEHNRYADYDEVASSTGTYLDIHGERVFTKKVHSEGGGEGEGEHVEVVYEFSVGPDVAYLRTFGHYESYNGTEWGGEWQEVVPREVVVTQYFPVGQ